MLNFFDRVVALYDPQAAVRRAQARRVLAHYDAAKPGRLRKDHTRKNPSPNDLAQRGAVALRNHARYLERNHDITRGVLRTLVNNVVGATGIGIEPQPRRKDGSIHTEYAAALRALHRQWCKRPEVTGRMHWAQAERMLAYTWLRDGEAFAQQVIGPAVGLVHGSQVPYSLELLEPDFVPIEYNDPGRGIRQGVQLNAWGRPTGYLCHKHDPREAGVWVSPADLKTVPAANMLHLSTMDRLHQVRGVSEFASVLTRVEDLKDYEESERIAAKVAASMGAYVKRIPGPEGYEHPTEGEAEAERNLRMQPGMIFDGLKVGEEIGMIDTNRPNPNLVSWRSGQLRAYAAGVGASYSSISRDYDGTYSALRQELVEQWVHYAVLTDDFAGQISLPVYESLVRVAHLSGVLPTPKDVQPGTEAECLLIGQQMPWIDPLKEAKAWELLAQSGFASEVEIIRRRGGNPREMLEQITEWRREAQERGLRFTSDAAHAKGAAATGQEAADEASGDGREEGAGTTSMA